MGARYRKSINLGRGARVTVSKRGISYSVGRKGMRVTKRADGRVQATVSASGTGLSYTKTSKGKSRPKVAPPKKARAKRERYRWEPKSRTEERLGYIMLGVFLVVILLVWLAN